MELMSASPEVLCGEHAARQHGVLSYAQVLACGMSRSAISRRVAAGRWEMVLPSVYRLAGVPSTWYQRLMAACLWAGPTAAVSHNAAAALLGLERFKRGTVEISTTANRKSGSDWLTCHRVVALPQAQILELWGLPVTSAGRTLIDLAGEIQPNALERALDEVLRKHLASRFRIAWELSTSRSPGRQVLQRLLDVRLPGYVPPHGELEALFMRLVKQWDLPAPVREQAIDMPGFRGRTDFRWPQSKVAVETDGFVWHIDRHRWQRDRTKRNALTLEGFTVLQITWEDLTERPDEVMSSLSTLLRPSQPASVRTVSETATQRTEA
jgi:hypothetical protein